MKSDKVFILLSTAFFCGNLAASFLIGSRAVPAHGIHTFLCLCALASAMAAGLLIVPYLPIRCSLLFAFGRYGFKRYRDEECEFEKDNNARGTLQRSGNILAMAAAFFLIGATGYGAAAATEHMSGKRIVAERYAIAVKETIDSISFENRNCNALAKALMTGDRSSLTAEVKDSFRKSGASHILALSGMHLGIIYLLLGRVLGILGNTIVSRRIRSLTIIAAAGFYTLMTGAGESLVRAFLFILIAEICRMTGRSSTGLRTLCGALMIQLIITPLAVKSVGFQLSYLAMLGIFTLFPILEAWYPAKKSGTDPMQKTWSLAALSISCQTFTAPLVWFHFRSFPIYFLITNLIAMPLTTIIMILSIGCTILTGLGICPEFLVRADEVAIESLMFCLKVISGI